MLSKNVHKISCMGYELVLELGQKVGQLISKSEEKLWDIDIKNFTVSPLDQIKCNTYRAPLPPRRTYTILGERGFRENVFPRRALQLHSPLALKGFRGKHVTVRCTENYHPLLWR